MSELGNISNDLQGEELLQFLREEFEKLYVDKKLTTTSIVNLQVSNVVPNKPRQGYLAYADGTNWNPGSGEGVYRYDGSAWNYLG